MRPALNFIKLSGLTIFEQLQLEEALLRLSDQNWCLIQDGVSPSIVMGISGKVEEHLNEDKLKQKYVPVIKRFSGGGTVFVDQDTSFVSFIFQAEDINVSACPDRVFCWSEDIYRDVFKGYPFSLKERDYIFDERKFGGNAQYMRKGRWLHHSTFLWDYNVANMDYLLLPGRRPQYRKSRSHEDFLCRLSDYLKSRDEFWTRLMQTLEKRFEVKMYSFKEVQSFLNKDHRRATQQLLT